MSLHPAPTVLSARSARSPPALRAELMRACMRRTALDAGQSGAVDPTVRVELVRAALRAAFDRADQLRTGRITRDELSRCIAQLFGPAPADAACLSAPELDALLDACGAQLADVSGRLPIAQLVDALVPSLRHAGEGRAGLTAAGVRPGGADGAIKYERCRTGVFAPSAWPHAAVELARRSAAAPDGRLELEFVYGYGGLANAAPNLFYLSSGELVYYTAAVAIVLSVEAHAQRFFLGHTDDIHCLALDPSRTLVATGQTADKALGGRPFVCVWSAYTMQEAARLVHGKVNQIAAVGFGRDGALLATVGCSSGQPVHVWDWQAQALLFEVATGVQPAPRDVSGVTVLTNVYGVRWAAEPHAPTSFVTYGKTHLHWWARAAKGGAPTWSKEVAIFDLAPVVDVLCVEFAPNGDLVSGTERGDLYVWRGRRVVRVLRAHAGELRVLKMRANGCELLSAGLGIIHCWDVTGDLPILLSERSRALPAAYEGLGPPSIRAMDCLPGSQIFVVGTGQCDVWEVDAEPNILVAGHVADLVAVDAHPTRPNLFATAAASDRVFVWDADARKLMSSTRLKEHTARCVSWAPPDGKLLAVGVESGRVLLLDTTGADGAFELVGQVELRAEPTVLRFTSDGRRLAVGTRGATIELFAVIEEGLAYALLRLGVCVGHSSTVRQLDWSVDDTVLQSSCQAYELLYWDGLRAEQLRSDQRDRAWQTWSCTVGWPVMGIWPDGYDNTDINALDRSDGGSAAAAGVLAGGYVAVADDFGHVLLFNHPCVRDDAPHLRSRGHSSHVTGVRFLRGSQRCVSIGGHDRAVFQWALWRRDDPDSDT